MPNYKHGETIRIEGKLKFSSEYAAWHSMKNRCLNSNTKDYKNYGGRGITIDPTWMQFENFIVDMGRKPSSEYTLERIDTNGNYNKLNCEWRTSTQQNRNRRNNKLTEAKADKIRQLYVTGRYSKNGLAKMFNVSNTLIDHIIYNLAWR